MQFMDSVKLGDQGMVRILDPTRVNQASYTVSLNKNSEMYKDMSQKDFDEQVKEMSGKARTKVSLYIAHAIKALVKEGKFIIKILFFFLSKFDLYFQFLSSIEI
jgi:hypothetical protein